MNYLDSKETELEFVSICSRPTYVPPYNNLNVLAQIDRRKVVIDEVYRIVATIQMNLRWAHGLYRNFDLSSDPLLSGLIELPQKLEVTPYLSSPQLLPNSFLPPFLALLDPKNANGLLIYASLCSLYKFLQYDFFIFENHLESTNSLQKILLSVLNCNPKAADPEIEELISLKILSIFTKCIQHDAALLFPNSIPCDMAKLCLKISIQNPTPHLLHKLAEETLKELIKFVLLTFDSPRKLYLMKLYSSSIIKDKDKKGVPLNKEAEKNDQVTQKTSNLKNEEDSNFRKDEVDYLSTATRQSLSFNIDVNSAVPRFDGDPSATSDNIAITSPSSPIFSKSPSTLGDSTDKYLSDSKDTQSTRAECANDISNLSIQPSQPLDPNLEIQPDVTCAIELVKFSYSLIKPSNFTYSNVMYHIGLSLIKLILEIRISIFYFHPKLTELIENELNRYLIQVLKHPDISLSNYVLTLHVSGHLFGEFRRLFCFQHELFLMTLLNTFSDHFSSTNYGQTHPERLELILEVIVKLCKQPHYLTDLFILYDCKLYGNDLLSKLISFFFQLSVFPSTDTPGLIHYRRVLSDLAFEGLLSILNLLGSRAQMVKVSTHLCDYSIFLPCMAVHRQLKKHLIIGTQLFNKKPDTGLAYLQKHHVLPTPLTPKFVAQFVRENICLDKKQIGLYFSLRDSFHVQVLREYCQLFDITGQSFIDCFREFLESFLLPGEAPIIENIIDVWSIQYLKKEPHPFKSQDACFLLCMSVIMLNVDMYNPLMKNYRHISVEQYVNNLKGQNGPEGDDFPLELLHSIYKSIREAEINLSNMLVDVDLDNHPRTWKALSKAQRHQQRFFSEWQAAQLEAASCGVYDIILFDYLWRPFIAAFRSVFNLQSDQERLDRFARACYTYGCLAVHNRHTDAFNYLIESLVFLTRILDFDIHNGRRYMNCFLRDRRMQMATFVLFGLGCQYIDELRRAWKPLIACLLRLHVWRISPIIFDFEQEGYFKIGKMPYKSNVSTELGNRVRGLPIFSIVSNLWNWGGTSSGEKVGKWSREQGNLQMQCREILASCRLLDIISSCATVKLESLDSLLRVSMEGTLHGLNKEKKVAGADDKRSSIEKADSERTEEIKANVESLEKGQNARNQKDTEKEALDRSSGQREASKTGSLSDKSPVYRLDADADSTMTDNERKEEAAHNSDQAMDNKVEGQVIEQESGVFEAIDMNSNECENESSFHIDSKNQSLNDSSGENPKGTFFFNFPHKLYSSFFFKFGLYPQSSSVSSPDSLSALKLISDSSALSDSYSYPSKSSNSFLAASPILASKTSIKRYDETSQSSAFFYLDLLTHLTLLNAHRFEQIWPKISSHVSTLLTYAHPNPILEYAIFHFLFIFDKIFPVLVHKRHLVSAGNAQIPPHQSTATVLTQFIQTHFSPQLEWTHFYAPKLSCAAKAIFSRHVPILKSERAGPEEWESLLKTVFTLTMYTPEMIEEFVDLVNELLISSEDVGAEEPQYETDSGGKKEGHEEKTHNTKETAKTTLHTTENEGTENTTPTKGQSPKEDKDANTGNTTNDACQFPCPLASPPPLSLASYSSRTLLCPENIPSLFHILVSITSYFPTTLDLSLKAIDTLQAFIQKLPDVLLNTSSAPDDCQQEQVEKYLFEFFKVMIHIIAQDTRTIVRQHTLAQLQKYLLSSNVDFLTTPKLLTLFDVVIFPLIEIIIEYPNKKEKHPCPPVNFEETEETHLRVFSILCKTFLKSINKFQSRDLLNLWLRMLHYFEQCVKQGRNEVLEEATLESIKNILFVLSCSGILVPPSSHIDSQDTAHFQLNNELWEKTWQLMNQFAPSLKASYESEFCEKHAVVNA
ncbi:Golgi-specific brefeldin A-resistance guanine nucleotide exchange factor 1 homolog [Schistocerca gregaria]|uniref:Golgi-specific brefeldin A-resistance guanine nucleotide exchange factor 1 homolog n=1 Tax=Schistocerca gregaria TaxID=7010 RepID=UPI00211E79A3|nr:Golgi-specific brefeldin A-resistance guanine nucleotide exchange factor 1 homolog [Schistocerca gregaria]